MSLIQTIQTDIVIALKSREKTKLEALRFIVSQVKYKQIEVQREITDDDVVGVIRKQLKELTEAAEQFRAGNRQDLVTENMSQIAIIKQYLPLEITDEELIQLVESFIKDNLTAFTANPRVLTGKVVGALKTKAVPDRIVKVYNAIVAKG